LFVVSPAVSYGAAPDAAGCPIAFEWTLLFEGDDAHGSRTQLP